MKKEKNVVSLIISIIMVVAITGIAYAYFTAVITNNNENNVVLEAKSMRMTFADGEGASINAILDLGESTTKKFVLTNTGNTDTYARIMWKDLVNTFIYMDLKYTLSWSTEENGTYTNLTYMENIPTSITASDQVLKGGIYVPANTTYYFKLVIQYMDWEEWDQVDNLTNGTFSTNFSLESAYEDESTETLLALGLISQNKISNYGDYDHIATTDETANGLFAIEDDYGTSYYFRGAVENNYVKFGKYSDTAYYGYKTAGDTNDFMVYKDEASCTAGIQVAGAAAYNVNCTPAANLKDAQGQGKDMYWRIIRINGDGSLRMIYDGTRAWTNEMMESATNEEKYDRLALRNKPWNLTYRNDIKYDGYMYGGENGAASNFNQADMTHTYNGDVTILNDEVRLSQKYYNDPYNSIYNQTDTNMKTMLTNWYQQNLKDSYDSYLSDEIFCNDRTISTNGRKWWGDDTMRGYGNGITRFGVFLRHYTKGQNNYNNQSHSPYLKCDQKNDAFTKSDTTRGNGKLGEKVGLITADEINIAGGRYYRSDNSSNNNGYYLYKGAIYALFSPFSRFADGDVGMIVVNDKGTLSSGYVTSRQSVIPVINLSAANARQLTGNGTAESPFELNLS